MQASGSQSVLRGFQGVPSKTRTVTNHQHFNYELELVDVLFLKKIKKRKDLLLWGSLALKILAEIIGRKKALIIRYSKKTSVSAKLSNLFNV